MARTKASALGKPKPAPKVKAKAKAPPPVVAAPKPKTVRKRAAETDENQEENQQAGLGDRSKAPRMFGTPVTAAAFHALFPGSAPDDSEVPETPAPEPLMENTVAVVNGRSDFQALFAKASVPFPETTAANASIDADTSSGSGLVRSLDDLLQLGKAKAIPLVDTLVNISQQLGHEVQEHPLFPEFILHQEADPDVENGWAFGDDDIHADVIDFAHFYWDRSFLTMGFMGWLGYKHAPF